MLKLDLSRWEHPVEDLRQLAGSVLDLLKTIKCPIRTQTD
jgi:hypothetical protein